MQACRVGDIGIGVCYSHKTPQAITGTIMIGSPNVQINSMSSARFGDPIICSCGHVSILIPLIMNVTSNSIPQCVVGDIFTGPATGSLIIGSPNYTIL